MSTRARTSSLVRKSTALLLFLGALTRPLATRAHDRVVPETRIESARGVALGTGVRSSALATHAQADNPANLARGGLYHIEGFVGYQPTFRRVGWGASVVDSMTSRIAAGLSARGLFGDNKAGDNAGWEGRLGIAFPLAEMLSVGLAGRYMSLTVSDPKTPTPPVKAGMTQTIDQTFKVKAFTMDAALTLTPIDGLSISALGNNLIDTKNPLAPLTVGGSLSYSAASSLTIGGDVLADLNTHHAFDGGAKLTLGGGLEYLVSGVLPLRAGYLQDLGRKQGAVTAGIGYVASSFGLQVGLRQVVSGGAETTIFGALSYFVQ